MSRPADTAEVCPTCGRKPVMVHVPSCWSIEPPDPGTISYVIKQTKTVTLTNGESYTWTQGSW